MKRAAALFFVALGAQAHDIKENGSNPLPPPAAQSELLAPISASADAPDASGLGSEERVIAKTLVFWNLSNGRSSSPALLASAGYTLDQIRAFNRGLRRSERPSRTQLRDMRADFERAKLQSRIDGRGRFLKFVSRYQQRFPDFKDVLPEILTVWGETRGIGGLTDEETLVQQAKMASIIHVLRNRSRKQQQGGGGGLKGVKALHEIKWDVATRRYQFSAFEPYDPNLAQIAFGPQVQGRLESLDSLPLLDRKALVNLAAVVMRMARNEIQLTAPLGDLNVAHYLTPSLIPYDKTTEHKMTMSLRHQLRQHLLRVPSMVNPRFLAMVPQWATQDAAIVEPAVNIQDPKTRLFAHTQIPADSFIYFRGVK